ncbi:hypothetical protein AruPA_06095 [Acidiphilium sp. PA]|uniref:hypothetical protein n=1 Tax=Acidiphilium sp. PA TaxID=2871705 RepID=UPI0022441386|nr:hypothetical protein [Acidiphilium sp. PA]MCW8306601.1 hypothetical protein [Acidiphilium sp. PA]
MIGSRGLDPQEHRTIANRGIGNGGEDQPPDCMRLDIRPDQSIGFAHQLRNGLAPPRFARHPTLLLLQPQ